MCTLRSALVAVALMSFVAATARAQTALAPDAMMPRGANRGDVAWHQIQTDHFLIVFHDGLLQQARRAAAIAEAIRPAVIASLGFTPEARIPIYLSNLDAVPNAIAVSDRYIYIWMRGVLDAAPFGSVRAAGRSMWLRSAITHEFTHIAIESATSDVARALGAGGVPRWFHEGVARLMEPDGWTTDVDGVLRAAAARGMFSYDELASGAVGGTLVYEGGHALVRFMLDRYGSDVLQKILLHRTSTGLYDFPEAVRSATNRSVEEVFDEWRSTVTTLYAIENAAREPIRDVGRTAAIPWSRADWIAASGDGGDVAATIASSDGRRRIEVGSVGGDGAPTRTLVDRIGIDDQISWSPDGSAIVYSCLHHGSHRALVQDLYVIGTDGSASRRLTSDANLSDPAWSPDGSRIVAVVRRLGHDDLVTVDPRSGDVRALTDFDDGFEVSDPTWSPDGRRIAFSMLDEQGRRNIATIGSNGRGLRMLSDDGQNDRRPAYSPDGRSVAYASDEGGVSNIVVVDVDGTRRRWLSDSDLGVWGARWVHGGDSVEAVGFDHAGEIRAVVISADQSVRRARIPALAARFAGWRSVRPPVPVEPTATEGASVAVRSEGYDAAEHISTLLPFVPLAGTDRTRDGASAGVRVGAMTVWRDPLQRHTIVAEADVGTVSWQPGGEVMYVNRTMSTTIAIDGDLSFGYSGQLCGHPVYERHLGVSVIASYDIPHPDVFNLDAVVSAAIHRRSLRPWNTAEWTAQDAATPESADLTELAFDYDLRFGAGRFSAGLVRSEPLLGSDRAYTRLSVDLDAPHVSALGIRWSAGVDLAAQWGASVSQEQLGLTSVDEFDGGFSPSSLLGFDEAVRRYRMPGVRREVSGNAVALATLGPVFDLERLTRAVPVVRSVRIEFIPFIDAAAVSVPQAEDAFAWSVGMELRTWLWSDFRVDAGLAFEAATGRGDPYLRLSRRFDLFGVR